jgi:hypothetical protein
MSGLWQVYRSKVGTHLFDLYYDFSEQLGWWKHHDPGSVYEVWTGSVPEVPTEGGALLNTNITGGGGGWYAQWHAPQSTLLGYKITPYSRVRYNLFQVGENTLTDLTVWYEHVDGLIDFRVVGYGTEPGYYHSGLTEISELPTIESFVGRRLMDFRFNTAGERENDGTMDKAYLLDVHFFGLEIWP